MAANRDRPSTRARQRSYEAINNLERFLARMFFPQIELLDYLLSNGGVWLHDEFNKLGWKDYVIRHTPENKRGGLDESK